MTLVYHLFEVVNTLIKKQHGDAAPEAASQPRCELLREASSHKERRVQAYEVTCRLPEELGPFHPMP